MSSFISHVIGPEQSILQCPRAVSILLVTNNALHQCGPFSLQSRAVVHLRVVRWMSSEAAKLEPRWWPQTVDYFEKVDRQVRTAWQKLGSRCHRPGSEIRTAGVTNLSNGRSGFGRNRCFWKTMGESI